MKRFPIICPLGAKVFVTQGFQPTENPSHDAIDFILYNPLLSEVENQRLSYGSQLVCPVPKAQCLRLWDEGTFQELGNGVDIDWYEDGFWWSLHFWHTVTELVKIGDYVVDGQVVGLMGNTGYVLPAPTPLTPFQGTHCHMRFSRYKKDMYNFGNIEVTSLDPRLYFDVNNPYQGVDNSNTTTDLIPIRWSWDKLGLKDNLSKLLFMLKNIFK